MEVLTATSVACLTIYDMCKSIDKNIEISEIKLDKKTGGKNLFEYYNPKTAILTLSDTRNKKTDFSRYTFVRSFTLFKFNESYKIFFYFNFGSLFDTFFKKNIIQT